MSEYSVSVNDWNYEEWNFIGRNIAEEKYGEWAEDNEKGISEDDFIPMMLYAYPLYSCPSDEQILEIQEETCLTVVENNESGDCFLALCGGGMDLSQNIAMAYIIAEDRIPSSLAREVSTQEGLNFSGVKWRKIMRYCRESLENSMRGYRYSINRIKESVKESKIKKQ